MTPGGFPILQLTHDTIYLEIVPPPDLRYQLQIQVVMCASDQLGYKSEVPMATFLGPVNFLGKFTELRIIFYSLNN